MKKLLLSIFGLWLGSAALADFVFVSHNGQTPNLLDNNTNNDTDLTTVTLYVFGEPDATGVLNSNDGVFSNTPFTIGPDGFVEITIPNSQTLLNSDAGSVENKAVSVTSDSPISGYVLHQVRPSTDMSYLLDIEALGTEYRVVTHPTSNVTRPAQMSVTATVDNTTVTITPSVSLSTGQAADVPFNVTLNAGESVLYNTALRFQSLTGSLISADNPVAVFSGNTHQFVGNNQAFDHMFTQLPPTSQYDTEYVIPETQFATDTDTVRGDDGNLIYVITNTDNTEITLNGTVVATINAGESYSFSTSSGDYLTASEPVLVAQVLKSEVRAGDGDPGLTFLPSVNQGLDSYVFFAPDIADSNIQRHYLSIAIPNSALSTLTLDGTAIDTSSFVPVAGSSYSYGNVQVTPGQAGLLEASAPFIANLSGYGNIESYFTILGTGYSPGASLPLSPSTSTIPSLNLLSLCLLIFGLLVAVIRGRQFAR